MEYYGVLWNTMESYEILWNPIYYMKYYGILWHTMESYIYIYLYITWNTMECYIWNTTEYYEGTWKQVRGFNVLHYWPEGNDDWDYPIAIEASRKAAIRERPSDLIARAFSAK